MGPKVFALSNAKKHEPSPEGEGLRMGCYHNWLSEVVSNSAHLAVFVDATDIGYEIFSSAVCVPSANSTHAWLPLKA